MHTHRLQSSSAQFHSDPKIGRLILVSLVLHVLLVLVMSGTWFGPQRRDQAPVYYVDLVHKPVLDPQAGRPDPRPKAKPKPAPVKSVAVPQPPKVVEPKKPTVKVAKPAPPTVVKSELKPDPKSEQKLQSAIDAMRERQSRQAEIDALKQKLAGLQDTRAAAVPADVPVGMPTGTGHEVGVSMLAYIQEVIKQNWALSPYLLDQSRLASIEAKVSVRYATDGKLVGFRILKDSGDSQFDDSIKRAITKSKQLQHKLPQSTELTVVFNLKEMAEARR
ncbi:MAG: TonB C-terminal domain-containing protein [Desulfuromonadales bacterium]|nr:TonB C-terminal domain-containing protein [Desulfuromonadales bacterium]